MQCAWVAARNKNSCGAKKAVVAVAASTLTTAYQMLADGTCYQDLGADHFTRRNPARAAANSPTASAIWVSTL